MSFPVIDDNQVIGIGGILTGDVLVLEMPGLAASLCGHSEGVVPVLAVDGFDGLCELGLAFAVHRVKETGLDGFVPADVKDDDPGILIMVHAVTFPVGAEHACGQCDQLLMVVCRNLQRQGTVNAVRGQVRTEP